MSFVLERLAEWKEQLCTQENPCFKAYDKCVMNVGSFVSIPLTGNVRTPKGLQDLSDRVQFLELHTLREDPWEFALPYTVEDDAGNRAGKVDKPRFSIATMQLIEAVQREATF
jgi:hypothetical protein